jgi:hypothetical protein
LLVLEKNVPRNAKITADQEEEIIAALTAKPHALQVARDTGWSLPRCGGGRRARASN